MEVQQVTTPTERTKAPGRVAWGKKLAEMRRQQKQQPPNKSEVKASALKASAPNSIESPFTTQSLIGFGCLTVGVGALYYQYRSYQSQQSNIEQRPVQTASEEQPEQQGPERLKPEKLKPSSKSRLTDMM